MLIVLGTEHPGKAYYVMFRTYNPLINSSLPPPTPPDSLSQAPPARRSCYAVTNVLLEARPPEPGSRQPLLLLRKRGGETFEVLRRVALCDNP